MYKTGGEKNNFVFSVKKSKRREK